MLRRFVSSLSPFSPVADDAVQYAILDECTSAVTLEVEKTFYERATGSFDSLPFSFLLTLVPYRTRHHPPHRLSPPKPLEVPHFDPPGPSFFPSSPLSRLTSCFPPVLRRRRVRLRSPRMGGAAQAAGGKAAARSQVGRSQELGGEVGGSAEGEGGEGGEERGTVAFRVSSSVVVQSTLRFACFPLPSFCVFSVVGRGTRAAETDNLATDREDENIHDGQRGRELYVHKAKTTEWSK